MRAGRWIGAAAGLAIVGISALFATSKAATTDAERRARIDQMYESYAKRFPDVAAVEAADAVRMLDRDDVVFVDVREPGEQAVSIIPGALTREAFDARREALRDRTVVTYCTIGFRSGMYARELKDEGFEVRNLAGSLLAWTHAEGPLVRDGAPTRDVHVYGKRWNLAASTYRAMW